MLCAPRRLSASTAMLKTVQLRVEDPVALTGSYLRRDVFRQARRCSSRFNSVLRTPWRSRAPSCAATSFGERGDALCAATSFGKHGDAEDGSTPCRGPRLAHGLLRAPRRHSASAAMLCAPRRHSASAAILKTVQLHVEGPVAHLVGCRRRDDFRRARRCSRRFKSVSWTPWRSRAPSCAATSFGERGDAQDGSTLSRGPRIAHGLLRAPRRLSPSAAMLKTVQLRVEDLVALTDFFVRRDTFRRARRCSRRFNSV